MIDENTVMVALAKGAPLPNLQENPNAMFMIMESGSGILDCKGIRVYLKMKEYITSGPQLDMYENQTIKIVGEKAADMIKVLATFEDAEVRPLVNFGKVGKNQFEELSRSVLRGRCRCISLTVLFLSILFIS
jgi:hypothetical protein